MHEGAEWRVVNTNKEKSVVERILENRGLTDPEAIENFLNPDFEKHLHSPYLLKDLDVAVDRIFKAMRDKERIIIYGDYDADGVTASALLYDFFHLVGADFTYILPHRLNDGYGVTPSGVEKARELGASLIVTVDNGITACNAARKAKELGMDLIITDHHQQGETLPEAYAVVNPSRHDCAYPFKQISGVGVAYKLVTALAQKTLPETEADYFLKWSLDLVAMGTVADLVPLIDENRTLVYYGLKVIEKAKRPGIRALLNKFGHNNHPVNTVTIGYQLGPKINAAGRLEKADIALKLLIANDLKTANVLADNLNEVNHQRQKLTQEALDEAENIVDVSSKIILAVSKKWHPGIIGLVAGKLCEKYNRPVIAFAYVESEKAYKGSARSPEYFDITAAMMSFHDELVNVGGHRQAGGCTVADDKIEQFSEHIRKYVEKNLEESQTRRLLEADTILEADEINLETLSELNRLAPFGTENPNPMFLIKDLEIRQKRTVGYNKRHLQMRLAKNGKSFDAIGFGLGELADGLDLNSRVDIMALLSENNWRNEKKVQLMIKDIRPAGLVTTARENLIADSV